jgi:chitin disaccharide deacetylase
MLIINADDLGYDPAVSRGIVRALNAGVVTSATLMVNTPFAAEAARWAQGHCLGLHLNLARWRPVSSAFTSEDLGPGGVFREELAARLPVQAIAAETTAQLERFKTLSGRLPTHVDVHKHLHRHPNVLEGLAQVAARQRLPVRSIDEAMRTCLRVLGVRTNDAFLGDAGATAYWTTVRLAKQLRGLGPGVTELMCHPGYAPSEVESGYGAQREVELDTFLNPDSRVLLEEAGVHLVAWSALGG